MKYLKTLSKFLVVCVALTFTLSVVSCAVTRTLPDGTVVVEEPDYASIQLMATASVAAWAASQKNGIKRADAENLLAILATIESFHADGSPIRPEMWAPVISKEVPPRYQALAMVLVTLVAHELDKRGLAEVVPAKGSVPEKVISAIVEGAKMGLAPYLMSYDRDHLLFGIMPAGYSAI